MNDKNAGWIKLHRKIKDHWLWRSDNRLKWWLDIIFTVNHSDSKVLIKGQLIECKRGQSVRSLEKWARDWGVTKKSVSDFFKLLRKDLMIKTENLKITTRITVCNYDNYQKGLNDEETERKRTGYLNKNNKEIKEMPNSKIIINTLPIDAK